jgi:phosphohistidine swiveling domain-containing protein
MRPVFLDDKNLRESDLERMGGKASSLSRLLQAGFPVPPGFVLFEKTKVLEEAVRRIGGFPVAVRSSGSLEDLPNASFAGLYETFLFVRSMEELHEAIEKCFQSKDSERVKDYLRTKNISFDDQDLSMSVLIQRMVDSQIAGVLFTLNPTSGKEEECYLEFCRGVGERLVSGHVTPSTMCYNWMEEKIVAEVTNAEGTKIPEKYLRDLVSLSAKIQAYYGSPQDIEWGIDPDDKLFILQSRPVTTFSPREDRPEMTNADLKDGGISARVCTHFMFSVYREALEYSMGTYFKVIKLIPNDDHIQWLYYHYGRAYWNAEAVKEGLKKIPDFDEEAFDRDLGIQKDYGAQGPHQTGMSVSGVVAAIPILIALNKEFLDCKIMITHFRDRFELKDGDLKRKLPILKSMTKKEFQDWFLDVIMFQKETERNYFRTIYNNSNFQTEYKSFLKKLQGYEEGDEIDLMSELHGVAHLDVQSGLKKLRRSADLYGFDSNTYHADREQFLKHHYHHGPSELDLSVPRWGEKKEWVDDLVRSFVDVPVIGESKYHQTFERIRSKTSVFKKGKFKKLTEESREYLRLREEMRSYSTRAYFLLRLGLLEFARRRSFSELEIFMYDIIEIKNHLLEGRSLQDTSKRKLYYQGYRSFKAPHEFGGSIVAMKSSSSSGLKGLGCSPGECEGVARVILDIHQTGSLTKNDILVTTFTDPGWTPVLARVGGVITEVGGLLSHAAVIGREYKIPAILNLIDATKHIRDGSRIRMNGKSGVVEVLEKGPE